MLLNIQEAAKWASSYSDKEVSPTNISYLIQYGKIKKYGENGSTLVNKIELESYYSNFNKHKKEWEEKLGKDLNWKLSFSNLREKDTTKHVHRLHPYKGKFIPQLVEYFIDEHTDNFKTEVFFNKNHIILDPFLGSGTAIIQANEMKMHGVGIDISPFNCLIAECKIRKYDLKYLRKSVDNVIREIEKFEINKNIVLFENELSEELSNFNNKYFPGYQFKHSLSLGLVNEGIYSKEKEKEFLQKYIELVKKYNIQLKQNQNSSFLDIWFIDNIRKEINLLVDFINQEQDNSIKQLLKIILSRTVRSCRATTHYDLATLVEPQFYSYYCRKHKKICKPLFSIKQKFKQYAYDSIKRIDEFSKLRTDTFYSILNCDSRSCNIYENIAQQNKDFSNLIHTRKINGIFSSPPYVGQIDYHEQHAYSYELFGIERKDPLEIGSLSKGQNLKARQDYIEDISKVLTNCKKYLINDFNMFIVANDKYNIYPEIALKSGLKIVNSFKRPVLNRTEGDKNPYCEIIFQMKDESND